MCLAGCKMILDRKVTFFILVALLGITALQLTQRVMPSNHPLPFSKDVELIRYFNKKGFGLPVLPNKTRMWTQTTRLCIMFNSVHKSHTVGLMLSYYLQFFDHITLLFDTTGGPVTRPHYVPDTVQAFGCDSYYGWYQHKCLNICLSHAAVHDIKGFLYIADDMFINITKMASLDPLKVWFLEPTPFNYSKLIAGDNKGFNAAQWYWFGFPHYNEYYLKKVIDKFPQKWINQLKQNAGFPDHYQTKTAFDIIYIPRSLASPLEEVISYIVNTTQLFCEVAGPLAVGVVAHPKQRVVLSNGYLWKGDRTTFMKLKTAETKHFVHPIKIGKSREEAHLWQDLMKHQMEIAVVLYN